MMPGPSNAGLGFGVRISSLPGPQRTYRFRAPYYNFFFFTLALKEVGSSGFRYSLVLGEFNDMALSYEGLVAEGFFAQESPQGSLFQPESISF